MSSPLPQVSRFLVQMQFLRTCSERPHNSPFQGPVSGQRFPGASLTTVPWVGPTGISVFLLGLEAGVLSQPDGDLGSALCPHLLPFTARTELHTVIPALCQAPLGARLTLKAHRQSSRPKPSPCCHRPAAAEHARGRWVSAGCLSRLLSAAVKLTS